MMLMHHLLLVSALLAAPAETDPKLRVQIPFHPWNEYWARVWSYSASQPVFDSGWVPGWTARTFELPVNPGWYAVKIWGRNGSGGWVHQEWRWAEVLSPYDLSADIELSPDEPYVGEPLTMKIRIKCHSAASRSPWALVRFYNRNGYAGWHWWISPMAPGEERSWTFTLRNPADELYWWRLSVAEGDGSDTNPSNNVDAEIFRPTKGADLAVTSITLNPEQPQIGSRPTAWVTVRCLRGVAEGALLRLYDGNPHLAYYDDLAVQKTTQLMTVPLDRMTRGDSYTHPFTFAYSSDDRLYNLHAVVTPGASGDPNPQNDFVTYRFRPTGGEDISFRALHVVFEQSKWGRLSPELINHQKQVVRAWADRMWRLTLCVKIKVDSIVLSESPRSTSPTITTPAESIMPQDIWQNLLARGINLFDNPYALLIVHYPVDHENGQYASGYGFYMPAINGGLGYIALPLETTPHGMGTLMHEFTHYAEGNFRGLIGYRPHRYTDFPSTHTGHSDRPLEPERERLYEAIRNKLEDKTWRDVHFTEQIDGVSPYWNWVYETWPVDRWRNFEGKKEMTPHVSDDYSVTGGIYEWLLLGPLVDGQWLSDPANEEPWNGMAAFGKWWTPYRGVPNDILASPRHDPSLAWVDAGIELQDVLERGRQKDNAHAYAFVYLYSDREQDVYFRASHGEGLRFMLNGNPWKGFGTHEYRSATLRQGKNRLLLEIPQTTGMWGFNVRATDYFGDPLPGVRAAAHLE